MTPALLRTICLLVSSASLISTAGAQPSDALNARPVPVAADQLGSTAGQADTWDGRVFVLGRPYGDGHAWVVRVFRPELVQRDGRGAPDLSRRNAARDRAYVQALHQDLLGRAPNPAALDEQARRHGVLDDRAAAVWALIESVPYRTQQVDAAYRDFLRRAPSAAELDAGVRLLEGPPGRRDLLARLLGSPEYRTLYPPADAWIDQLYRDLLGRPADAGGIAYWTAELSRRGGDYEQTARAFTYSEEFATRELRPHYQRLLGRAPTSAEAQALAQRITSGGRPLEQALVTVLESQEYVDRRLTGAPAAQREVFSAPVLLEMDGDPRGGITGHGSLAITPTPGLIENPFPADAQGAPQLGGAYRCYDVLIHTVYMSLNLAEQRLGVLRARIVVGAPQSADAFVARTEIVSPFRELRATDGQVLRGIEPTLTHDGHLLIWQGHPANDGRIDVLMASYTHTPGAPDGWTPPRCVSALHQDRDVMVAGLPLHERAPLAREPLKAGDGTPYAPTDLYLGAYPWISLDGTELFHTQTVAGTPGVDQARRGAVTVVGRWTGWSARHIDGPINPDRHTTVRFFSMGPGPSPGLWRPFPEAPDAPFPYTAAEPVYCLFGAITSVYAEVSLEDYVDGDYALVLGMNEVVRKDGSIDSGRTPDTSGHWNTGTLEGARFPQEYDQTDVNRGVVGQAIHFAHGDRVRVARSASLDGLRERLTAEVFVQRVVDLAGASGDARRSLLRRQGAFELVAEEDGRISAAVTVGGRERKLGPLGPALPVGAWGHVALTYEANTGRLVVYRDGQLAGQGMFGPGAIDASSRDLEVGPAGRFDRASSVGAGQAELLLDQVKLSRVARTPSELARAAFRAQTPTTYDTALPVPLPLGLDPRDLRIPAGANVTREQVDLGQLLFFDPRLSANQQTSCATCHEPARAFTDGRALALSPAGGDLPRNSPTVLNRAFSTTQFWDGRSASLEEQAAVPLEHPRELNLSADRAAATVQQVPGYVQRFQAAFGRAPNAQDLLTALAHYQRTLLSGDSRVDRFEAGDLAALSDAERRGRALFLGKARCAACHHGSNYSDESFHHTGVVTDLAADPGRYTVTARGHDRGRFKTPTLRDVDLTAPYLHDGSAATLEEVVDLYDRGGRSAQNRDPEARPLGLTPSEKADLVAFMKALTGSTRHQAPAALPTGSVTPPPPPAPVATPEIRSSGRWFKSKVRITCATAGATIHVTTDGSEPTVNSPVYAGELKIRRTTTVKARAYLAGQPESAVASRRVKVSLGKGWWKFW